MPSLNRAVDEDGEEHMNTDQADAFNGEQCMEEYGVNEILEDMVINGSEAFLKQINLDILDIDLCAFQTEDTDGEHCAHDNGSHVVKQQKGHNVNCSPTITLVSTKGATENNPVVRIVKEPKESQRLRYESEHSKTKKAVLMEIEVMGSLEDGNKIRLSCVTTDHQPHPFCLEGDFCKSGVFEKQIENVGRIVIKNAEIKAIKSEKGENYKAILHERAAQFKGLLAENVGQSLTKNLNKQLQIKVELLDGNNECLDQVFSQTIHNEKSALKIEGINTEEIRMNEDDVIFLYTSEISDPDNLMIGFYEENCGKIIWKKKIPPSEIHAKVAVVFSFPKYDGQTVNPKINIRLIQQNRLSINSISCQLISKDTDPYKVKQKKMKISNYTPKGKNMENINETLSKPLPLSNAVSKQKSDNLSVEAQQSAYGFITQPQSNLHFRYKSDQSNGTLIKGTNNQKNGPVFLLPNHERAELRVSLVDDDSDHRAHSHKLLDDGKQIEEKKYASYGEREVALKDLRLLRTRRKDTDAPGLNFNVVRLKINATINRNSTIQELTDYSDPIYNVVNGNFKIFWVDKLKGFSNDSINLLCSKTDKETTDVEFSCQKYDWKCCGEIKHVHRQHALEVQVPVFKYPEIEEPTSVEMKMKRLLSSGEIQYSNTYIFVYMPNRLRNALGKRRHSEMAQISDKSGLSFLFCNWSCLISGTD